MNSIGGLPDYENPPVVEVVFAVSFGGLSMSTFDIVRFGLENLEEDFPTRSEQPPVHMPSESFDQTAQLLAPTIALLTGPPPIRLWFQTEDQSRLIQLQRDWMACNWRSGTTGNQYTRYHPNQSFFMETWKKLERYSQDIKASLPVPNQCELTYINQIEPGELLEHVGEIDKVIRTISSAGEFLPMPEETQFGFRYLIEHEGQPAGRLYIQGMPTRQPLNSRSSFHLQIIARGAPLDASVDGMIKFYDLAHDWIVNGFAAVTTEAAQNDLWGRKA